MQSFMQLVRLRNLCVQIDIMWRGLQRYILQQQAAASSQQPGRPFLSSVGRQGRDRLLQREEQLGRDS
ncbi:hypothetical protein D3C71_2225250 [compost metagenome]